MVADEEDVAQEVFLSVFKRATATHWQPPEYPQDADQLSTFLALRTRAEVKGQLQKARPMKRGAATEGFSPGLLLDPGPTPDDAVSAREEWQRLLDCVTDEEHPIVMGLLEGLTHKEIAHQVGCSQDEIRTRIGKLKKKLESIRTDLQEPPGIQGTSDEPKAARPAQIRKLTPKARAPKPERLAVSSAATIDPVDCTVFVPPAACPGGALLVQVVAHTPAQTSRAKAMAEEFDEEAQRRGYTSLETDVERGSRLFFHLSMPGLEIDQPLRMLVWRGRPASVQFRVVVPPRHPFQSVVGTVTVAEEELPQGQITFKLKVIPRTTTAPPGPSPTGQGKPFEVFFISYASEDRPEVLKRVQMLARLGKRFFQDLLHLDPGDRWERKLYVYIDQSDAVLLFWSSKAKQSEWVMRECRYTIDTKGIDYLLPIIIEGPPPVEPPPELAELHMNDWLLYLMR
jgi:RNA polymerase sigma factor (sigma-70 family)